MRWAALVVLVACTYASGCSVYSPSLLDRTTDAATDGSTATTTGSATAADAAPPADAGMPERDEPVIVSDQQCAAGECWWSKEQSAGCRSAGRPTAEDRPSRSDDAAGPIADLYLGWATVRLGEAGLDGVMASNAWQQFGFDLDGRCTNSATCPSELDVSSCKSASAQTSFDGALCRDNSFASLQPLLARVPEIQGLGIRESTINCNLRRGTYNVVLKLSGYNGTEDDPDVRVDFYVSPGLDRLPAWKCEASTAPDAYPLWSAAAAWQIDRADLSADVTSPGNLPDSKIADPDAYVRAGYLVAQPPDGELVRLDGRDSPYRGLTLRTTQSLWVGKLTRAQDATWQLQGLAAGRARVDDLTQTFRRLGLCDGTSGAAQYQMVSGWVRDKLDLLASGEDDPQQPCDALSLGIAFEARQLTPGSAVEAQGPIECCSVGMAREDCQAKCGDGRVAGVERCDTAIAADQPGACPRSCTGSNTCEKHALEGSACDAHCVTTAISAVGPEDGCCPLDANGATDADCESLCGNTVIEPNETCDPPETCVPCDARNKCIRVRRLGSAESCDLACEYDRVEGCRNGDGCCPEACTSRTDSDCSPSCGNDVLEANETCEPGSPTPCPADCEDAESCTRDVRTGDPASCNVLCTNLPITLADDSDECCPAGLSANDDDDCAPVCGNRVREANEECDDGNRSAEDGCDEDCRMETPEQTCLALPNVGADDCARCSCQKCQGETEACYGSDNAEDTGLCVALRDCARSSGCSGSVCYCGDANSAACGAGLATGPCRSQVEAASKTLSVMEITDRSADLNYPVGRSNLLGVCITNNCMAECKPGSTASTPN
jgi:cysteine-rich repeat protein